MLGVDRDSAEALINEEGMIEVGRGQFSIEPFLFTDGKLVTWNDATTSVASNPEALPLPQVTWSTKDLDLTINAFAAGPADSSVLYARYRVANTSKKYKRLILYLAIRPFPGKSALAVPESSGWCRACRFDHASGLHGPRHR